MDRQGHRILIVDDDELLRLLNAEVLEAAGFQVDTAEDGEAGWDALQLRDYDLLITDNNMPKISGVELLEKIRSVDLDLPVIMVSGAMPVEQLNCQPRLCLSASLLKPFTSVKLLGTVNQVLSHAEISSVEHRSGLHGKTNLQSAA